MKKCNYLFAILFLGFGLTGHGVAQHRLFGIHLGANYNQFQGVLKDPTPNFGMIGGIDFKFFFNEYVGFHIEGDMAWRMQKLTSRAYRQEGQYTREDKNFQFKYHQLGMEPIFKLFVSPVHEKIYLFGGAFYERFWQFTGDIASRGFRKEDVSLYLQDGTTYPYTNFLKDMGDNNYGYLVGLGFFFEGLLITLEYRTFAQPFKINGQDMNNRFFLITWGYEIVNLGSCSCQRCRKAGSVWF